MDVIILSLPEEIWEDELFVDNLEEAFMAMGLNAIILPDSIKVTTAKSLFKEEDVELNFDNEFYGDEDDTSDFFNAYEQMKDIADRAKNTFRVEDRG